MKKDYVSILDLEAEEIIEIMEETGRLKKELPGSTDKPLPGKTLGMLFTKSSTRTRVSFEVGMYKLGGYSLFLSSSDVHLGTSETIEDTAKVLSRFLDGIMIRTFSNDDVVQLARHASIPVINGLTDLLHPCQILADLFSIYEARGGLDELKVAYIGDGNNVANSWINAAVRLPIKLDIACPEGYDPDQEILDAAIKSGEGEVRVTRDPFDAVEGADVIYTDVWTSMGQEEESAERIRIFAPYQVNEKLLAACESGLVMHCLPAHRGEEITDEVIDGPRSIVFDQAENRMHAQNAILLRLMGRQ